MYDFIHAVIYLAKNSLVVEELVITRVPDTPCLLVTGYEFETFLVAVRIESVRFCSAKKILHLEGDHTVVAFIA